MRLIATFLSEEREGLVWIDIDPGTKSSELVDRLASMFGEHAAARLRVNGNSVDAKDLVTEIGLRDGVVLDLETTESTHVAPYGPVDLCVTGGYGAGRILRLGFGETVVRLDVDGRSILDDVSVGTPGLLVNVSTDGSVHVRREPGFRLSSAAVTLETSTEAIGNDSLAWATGTQLRIGAAVLTVQPASRSDADLRVSRDASHLDYNRPPRLHPPMPEMSFRLPGPPAPPSRNPLPILAAAMPAVLGVVTAVAFQSPTFLLIALATPLMVLGTWWTNRRHGAKSHRARIRENEDERAAISEAVRDAVNLEQHRHRSSTPGAAELRIIAITPTRRLWERRAGDPDHLSVRLGLADAPSRVELEDYAEPEYRRRSRGTMASVPVTVPLAEAGVLGIAGPGNWPRRRARWIVGQLGVLQSPRDIRVAVLAASDTVALWEWAAWLPHLRPGGAEDPIGLLGSTADTLAARVAEITALIAERQAEREDHNSRNATFSPHLVVVLDGARRLRALPGVVGILRDGPAVGVSAICLDGDEQQLPEECTVVAVARANEEMLLRYHGADDVSGIVVDEVDDDWFHEVPRAIAAVIDVTASESAGLIPDSVRLVETLGIEELDAEALSRKWASTRGTTEAVVGVSIDGPISLDLVRDGPHALVAGTTGSGKSEFLQTVVASLALANTPQTMNFVLVDYKGGAAFAACASLPHTVGLVTDLDSHLVERALDSLRAELTYREHVLAAASAKDLEDYVDAGRRGHEGPVLPRLVIVIDEFAAMAKELPDFVTGLVGIAQRGRSLGIHLILATQRPSGVVSPEIRANTNLRIALRMTDKGESSDVIDVPDAARIGKDQAGRALARLGHASIIPFQTARVGGRRIDRSTANAVEPPFVAQLTTAELGLPAPRRPLKASRIADDTDLTHLVSVMREAATLAQIAKPRSPWLPPLPLTLDLASVATPSSGADFAWGIEDDPGAQRQHSAVIDLDDFSHLYIVGAPGSGRSTVLRTLAIASALQIGPADLHIYGIDAGNGALAVLDELPHTGAIVQRTQTERVVRLITRLRSELGRRQQLLARDAHASVAEQRRHAPLEERIPRILVLVDRWEGFVSTLGEVEGGALVDSVQQILRDGASAGIHLVVSGDRSLIASRMSTFTDDVILLRMTDRLDFGLAGIDHRKIPKVIGPGRGFRSGSAREVQTAIFGEDPSGRGQTEAARQIARTLAESAVIPPGKGPFRVDDIPSSITLTSAFTYTDARAAQPMWAMLGIGGDDISAVGMDLESDAPTFLVAGPARSGRSTLLTVMAESLLRGGTELVLVAPRQSPLRDLAGRHGVRGTITHTEVEQDELAVLLEPDGLPVVLIVDDGEHIVDAPAKAWLRDYVRTAADNRRGLILGGAASEVAGGFSGWQVDVKKNRRGALLSPQTQLEGDLLGIRLPRSSVSARVTPGRALVHLGSGELITVVVPHVDPS